MFSISNNELAERPAIGTEVICPHCGENHTVEYGKEIIQNPDGTETRKASDLMGFYTCGDKSYLAAINGVSIL